MRETLGFVPETTLDEGLQALIDWHREETRPRLTPMSPSELWPGKREELLSYRFPTDEVWAEASAAQHERVSP